MSERDSFDQLTNDLMNLYEAGNYADALELVEQNALRFPEMSARTTFWKMCLLSLEGHLDEALSTFRRGLRDGLWWAENRLLDTDLDPLRGHPEFIAMAAESKRRWERESERIKGDHILLVPDSSHTDTYPLLIALHGGAGTKEQNLEYWEVARQEGWLVLSPQSTQPLYPGAYCWNDGEQGVTDVASSVEEVSKEFMIDSRRVIIAGFSQGSGMAIYAALSGKVNVRGFIGIGTYWADPSSFAPLAKRSKSVRGYFITGKKDRFLEQIKEIQGILKDSDIPVEDEIHPDLGHEFPEDFERSFTQAIEFIFEE